MKKVTEYFYGMEEASKFKRNAEHAMFAQLDAMHDNPKAITDYTITIAGQTLVIDPCADNFEAIMGCVSDLIKIWEEDNNKDADKCDCNGCNDCKPPVPETIAKILEAVFGMDGNLHKNPGDEVEGFKVEEVASGEGFRMISLSKRAERK